MKMTGSFERIFLIGRNRKDVLHEDEPFDAACLEARTLACVRGGNPSTARAQVLFGDNPPHGSVPRIGVYTGKVASFLPSRRDSIGPSILCQFPREYVRV